MIPPGIEPGLSDSKSDVITAILRDHISKSRKTLATF